MAQTMNYLSVPYTVSATQVYEKHLLTLRALEVVLVRHVPLPGPVPEIDEGGAAFALFVCHFPLSVAP